MLTGWVLFMPCSCQCWLSMQFHFAVFMLVFNIVTVYFKFVKCKFDVHVYFNVSFTFGRPFRFSFLGCTSRNYKLKSNCMFNCMFMLFKTHRRHVFGPDVRPHKKSEQTATFASQTLPYLLPRTVWSHGRNANPSNCAVTSYWACARCHKHRLTNSGASTIPSLVWMFTAAP